MKVKLPFTVLISLILLLSSNGIAQGTWTQVSNFNTVRAEAASFSIGSKGYVGTGTDFYTTYKDFWEFDSTTKAWTQKADFGGEARWLAKGFSIGTKGYIGVGANTGTYYKDFWEWDQATNTWTEKTDFAGGIRTYAVGFSIGTKGYIGTGLNNLTGTSKKDFWEWDQATNTWTQKADFGGAPRYGAVGFSICNKGYIGTGFDSTLVAQNDLWEYDPATNIWTRKSNLPAAGRYRAAAFSICSKGYLGLGQNLSNTIYGDFWQYDPSSDTWTQKSVFPGSVRCEASFFAIGNKGYLGLGFQNGTPIFNDFYEYSPDSVCIQCSQCSSVAAFTSSDTSFCANSCIAFYDHSSCNPTSWQWNFQGATPATSNEQNPTVCYPNGGNYPVTLVVSNGNGNDSVTFKNFINVYPEPPTPLITQMNNDTLRCTTDTSYASYQWYLDSTLIQGATDTFLVITQGGNYNIKVTNKKGCITGVGTNIILGLSPASLSQFSAGWQISPDPVKDQFAISNLQLFTESFIEIYNVLGKKVYQSAIVDLKSAFNISTLPDGIYFLQIKNENSSWTRKFIKE
jgi:PKD repeat protein